MGKYIKYEIKGSYRFVLGVLALVLILMTGIYLKGFDRLGIVGGLAGLAIVIGYIAEIYYIMDSFRKELYEDRGYLTFTLPLSGKQIIASKLVVSTLWILVIGFVTMGYFLILFRKDINIGQLEIDLLKQYLPQMIYYGIYTLVFGINNLILIYLSMALGRVTIRNKKLGGLWFLIFIVLFTFVQIGYNYVYQTFPHYLNLSSFNLINIDNGAGLTISSGLIYMNLATAIYTILIGIVSFFTTSYLVENKIDI